MRAGYGWTVAALIERRLDARTANALSGLLGGASRAPAAPLTLETPGLVGFLDAVLGALAAFPDARAAVLAAVQKAVPDGGETTPRA